MGLPLENAAASGAAAAHAFAVAEEAALRALLPVVSRLKGLTT
jgi:hypothetical protein